MNIRKGVIDDVEEVYKLYKEVSQIEGGIARFEDEVTREYVEGFIKSSLNDGIFIVAEKEGKMRKRIKNSKGEFEVGVMMGMIF